MLKQLAVKKWDIRIMDFLKKSGDSTDWKELGPLVLGLVNAALEMDRVREQADLHGLDRMLLCRIYLRSLRALMPRPAIRHGGPPILVPSLVFMDDDRIAETFGLFTFDVDESLSAEDREEQIVENACEVTERIRATAESMRGPVHLASTSTTGCGAQLLVGTLLFVMAACAAL